MYANLIGFTQFDELVEKHYVPKLVKQPSNRLIQ